MRGVTRWLALLVTIFGIVFASSASAGPQLGSGERPREGRNYEFVSKKTDSQDARTRYVHLLGKKDINTILLAEELKTTQTAIRRDNPHWTLALCRHPGDGFDLPVIRPKYAMQDRARVDQWVGCPEDLKYTYVVPGSVLTLSGRVYLSNREELDLTHRLQECAENDSACVDALLKQLGVRAKSNATGTGETKGGTAPVVIELLEEDIDDLNQLQAQNECLADPTKECLTALVKQAGGDPETLALLDTPMQPEPEVIWALLILSAIVGFCCFRAGYAIRQERLVEVEIIAVPVMLKPGKTTKVEPPVVDIETVKAGFKVQIERLEDQLDAQRLKLILLAVTYGIPVEDTAKFSTAWTLIEGWMVKMDAKSKKYDATFKTLADTAIDSGAMRAVLPTTEIVDIHNAIVQNIKAVNDAERATAAKKAQPPSEQDPQQVLNAVQALIDAQISAMAISHADLPLPEEFIGLPKLREEKNATQAARFLVAQTVWVQKGYEDLAAFLKDLKRARLDEATRREIPVDPKLGLLEISIAIDEALDDRDRALAQILDAHSADLGVAPTPRVDSYAMRTIAAFDTKVVGLSSNLESADRRIVDITSELESANKRADQLQEELDHQHTLATGTTNGGRASMAGPPPPRGMMPTSPGGSEPPPAAAPVDPVSQVLRRNTMRMGILPTPTLPDDQVEATIAQLATLPETSRFPVRNLGTLQQLAILVEREARLFVDELFPDGDSRYDRAREYLAQLGARGNQVLTVGALPKVFRLVDVSPATAAPQGATSVT